MAELEYHPQRVEEALVKLAAPFWGKPRIASLVRAFARESQRAEDEAFELFACAAVATAPGWALALLGKLIGQARHGLNIEQFRLAILAHAIANRTQGGVADLLAVLEAVLGEVDVGFAELGNANLRIDVLDEIPADSAEVLVEVLPHARAAGVGLQFAYSTSGAFIWGESAWGSEGWATVRTL